MMKSFKWLLLLVLFSLPAAAQSYQFNLYGLSFSSGSSVPGSCSPNGSFFFKTTATIGWQQCVSGTYSAFGSGGGSVTSVAMTVPSWLSVAGSPILGAGTLAVTAASAQTSHQVIGTGAGTSVSLQALTGADLPNPSASTLGGVESIAAVSHQFMTTISTSGVPLLAQPAFSDISGTATSSQVASNVLYRVNSLQVLTAPTVATVLGTGAGTWGYKVRIKDSYGNILGVSSQGTTTNATTLDGSHTNSITCPASYPTFDGNTPTCDVYRTASAGTPANLSLLASAQAMGTVVTDNGSVNTATANPLVIVGAGASTPANLYAWTIPAGKIPAGKGIKFNCTFHRTGSATMLFDSIFGGTTNTNHVFSSTSITDARVEARIFNDDGATGSQSYDAVAMFTNAVNTQVFSKDTAGGTLAWAHSFQVAATDTMAPETFTVELLP